MKRVIAAVLFLALVFSLNACAQYQEKDFIGKTSAQIEAEYGAFDCCGKPADEDGLYRNTACGYTTQEEKVGFLGTEPEQLFFISFDENGVATEFYEGYRPGG